MLGDIIDGKSLNVVIDDARITQVGDMAIQLHVDSCIRQADKIGLVLKLLLLLLYLLIRVNNCLFL